MIYLSIIVPIRNEEKFIAKTLDLLISQDYARDRYEIIVVDGMSTDNSYQIVKSYINSHLDKNIILLKNPGILSSRARNIGVKAAHGKLIAVIDGHVFIPDNQLFRNMEQLKEENNALCLARPAPLDVPDIETGTGYWIAAARKSWLGHSKDSYIYSDYEGFVNPVSSGFAYDKSVFEKVGLFDEAFDAAEDVEFHFRLKQAGIQAITSPKLLIYSYPRESLKALFRQQVRYGEGRARFIKKHRDGLTKETPVPLLILLAHVLLPFFIITIQYFPYTNIPALSLLIIYWLVLLITGLRESIKEKKVLPGFIITFAIWTTHIGLGWGLLKYLLSSKK